MESNLSEFEQEALMRPTLLTVLCILTFIGSGWAIISSGWAYSTANKTARLISNNRAANLTDSTFQEDSASESRMRNRKLPFGQKMMLTFSKKMTADNIRKSAVGAIISAIFTLLGAILMFNQKRYGFYLYIVGILIGVGVPFYLYGNNLMSVGISSISSFFGLLFIALYALNIKSMR
jgi:ABC-type multidrug transport system fused ATPase/permease subunit